MCAYELVQGMFLELIWNLKKKMNCKELYLLVYVGIT